MQAHDLLYVFIDPLERLGLPYFVTGSMASIFYGEPRLTHDVDLVLHLSREDIPDLASQFSLEEFYIPPEEILEIEVRRRPFGHFNLIHHQSGFKADIYLSGEDKLHTWALAHRKKVDLGGGLSLWLAPPEYVILRKLEYFREGGSQKHIEDIKNMLPQVGPTLNQEFLDQEIRVRGLAAFWRRVQGS